MKSQTLVMPVIIHHRVAAPPRLVRVAADDQASLEGSKSIAAMRGVIAAGLASVLIWGLVFAAVL